MWLFLWALFNLTPVQAENPTFLWEQGSQSFSERDFPKSIFFLKKLVDRWPGQPSLIQSLEAHWKLGQSYFAQKQYSEAIAPLLYFSETRTHQARTQEQEKALLLLGRTYLALNRSEAASLTVHAVKLAPLQAESFLIQAQALLRKNQLKPASLLLDQAMKAELSASLKEEALLILLRIKGKNCAELPTRGALLESQFQDQLNRRGDCLLEMTATYSAQAPSLKREEAESEMVSTFQSYLKVCVKTPPPADRKKRSSLELKRYHSELANHMLSLCRIKLKEAANNTSSESFKTGLLGLLSNVPKN